MRAAITGYRGFIGKRLLSTCELSIGIGEKYTKEELYIRLNDFKPNVVFHIGACSDTLNTDVNYVLETNYIKTKWIADWCYGNNAKLIYASSAAIYGIDKKLPSNLYGWSKLLGEDYVINRGGIALRYFNVYGPGEEHKGKMASIAIQAYQKHKWGEKVFLFPKSPKRDFVHVKDVVEANIHAWNNYKKFSGNFYHVGSGEAKLFEDVLNIMNIPFEYTPEESIPENYQFFTEAKMEHFMEGWKPNYPLEKGVLEYLALLKVTTVHL